MSKKLFVGNLSWNVDNDTLRKAFETHGEITDAVVITDRGSGRSRGFGFVTFSDDDQAETAAAALNQTEIDGRTVKVEVAQERKDSRASQSGW